MNENSMKKIDKNIPLPEEPKGGRSRKYPWHEMEVGDSFYCNGSAARGSLSGMANRHYAPKRFVSRKWKDGIRVWRVA